MGKILAHFSLKLETQSFYKLRVLDMLFNRVKLISHVNFTGDHEISMGGHENFRDVSQGLNC
jgi:hypothetical protein